MSVPVSLFTLVQPRLTVFALAPVLLPVMGIEPLALSVQHPQGRRVCWVPDAENPPHSPASRAAALGAFMTRHQPSAEPAILLVPDYAMVQRFVPVSTRWPCPVVQIQTLAARWGISSWACATKEDRAPAVSLLAWWQQTAQPALPPQTTVYDLLRPSA